MPKGKKAGRSRSSSRRGAPERHRAGERTPEEIRGRAHSKMERGYSPGTAAGEYVREEIHHVREGKHGAANPRQAIAIGLSKARRAGVPLPPRSRGR